MFVNHEPRFYGFVLGLGDWQRSRFHAQGLKSRGPTSLIYFHIKETCFHYAKYKNGAAQ